MAAYLANSIGQLYVGFMAVQIGAGATMQLGGVITELMTALSAWRIPALLTYPRGASAGGADGGAPSTSAELAAVSEGGERAEPAGGGDDAWQLNDAAKAAAALETQTVRAHVPQPPSPIPSSPEREGSFRDSEDTTLEAVEAEIDSPIESPVARNSNERPYF